MKIHNLTLEGFGPFKHKQTIDFDKLSADRLFMLEGPTGAGKSSIIDAIVFALYGDTAQQGAGKAANAAKSKSETDRMSQHRIRSDYCGIDDPTEVTLEFSNGNGRYRVRRVPALPRLKRDGTEDFTNPKAELVFIRPEALPVTGPRDVNKRISEIVGLDEKQFNQLIVLPQGKFTTFLFADRNSRELILTDIFRTFFYDKIAEELSIRKKSFEESIKSEENELVHHIRNLKSIDQSASDKNWDALLDSLKNPSEVRTAQDFLVEGLVGDMYVDPEERNEELLRAESAVSALSQQVNDLKTEQEAIIVLEGLKKELEKLKRNDDAIKTKEAELKVITQLEPLLGIIEDFESLDKKVKSVERSIPKIYRDVSSKDLNSKKDKIETSLLVLEKELSRDENLEYEIESLEEKISDGEEIAGAKDELEAAKKRLTSLEKKFEKAKLSYESYRKNRTTAGASAFAKKLKAGQPCPVCGSKVHPNKAKGDGYDESREQELEQERDEAKDALEECKSEIRSLTVTARRKLPNLKDLQSKLALLEKRRDSISAQEGKRDSLRDQVNELKDALNKVSEYEGLRKEYEALHRQLNPHMKKHMVADVLTLKKLISKGSDALRIEIDSHNNEKVKLKGLISQDIYKNLRDLETVTTLANKIRTEIEKEKKIVSEITGQRATANSTNKVLESSQKGISKALDSLESLRKKGKNLLNLESVVRGSGRNKLDLKLQRYVLQEKLELVLERASGILYQISGGKYEFKLQEEKIKGQLGKSGLGITVLDLYAGKERPAETLSGGEAFYASLALALGLAEVIRADRGGLELGTLFIDEGFGSLDEDKLDEVLEVIEKLGASNRIIGVISHVESMKSRIPARLEVRSSKEGPSFVKMVGV